MNDINPPTSLVSEYGFTELPTVVEGHRTFVLTDLIKRYAERDGNYVIILHRINTEHFIMGVYEELREALQTRYVANLILHGGHKFDDMHFVQVHNISGSVIEDKIYNAKTNEVADFTMPEEETEDE